MRHWFSALLLVVACLPSFGWAADQHTARVNPSILSLPKGPGSIEGLGKSFQPHLNTGTFTYSVPLSLPPAAAGFAPKLELSYDSGAGNSPFGPGWSLGGGPLVIARQVEKGFPEYDASDTFVFGGEELVPLPDGSFRVENEGEFRRFTPQLSKPGGAIDHWLVEDPNGVKHWLGRDPQGHAAGCAVAHKTNPQDGCGTFDATYTWYEAASEDPNGNRIEYDYETIQDSDYTTSQDSPGVAYLSKVRYYAAGKPDQAQVVQFYYKRRPDALLDNRAGFAQVLGQRCHEIAIYSLRGGRTERLRAYVLSYEPQDGVWAQPGTQASGSSRVVPSAISLLQAVTQYDHSRSRNPDNPEARPGQPLPALRFGYSELDLGDSHRIQEPSRQALGAQWVKSFEAETDPLKVGWRLIPVTQHLPLDSDAVQFVDLNGDGLPDLLDTRRERNQGAWRIAINRGAGRFDPFKPCNATSFCKPVNGIQLGEGQGVLADLNGDGLADLATRMTVGQPETRIYPNAHDPGQPRDPNGTKPKPNGFDDTPRSHWTPYDLSLSGPAVRLIDLNFDKRTDVLVSNGSGLQGYVVTADGRWHSVGRQDWVGGADQQRYGLESPWVRLVDLNGDRLLDLVRLESQGTGQLRVYWRPMVGPVRWGEEQVFEAITVAGKPIGTELDATGLWGDDEQAAQSLHWIDVDGDGLTDLVQVRDRSVALWMNQGGAALRGPYEIPGTPTYTPHDRDHPTRVFAVDLLGTGGAGLLFHQRAGTEGDQFLSFLSGQKPGLLQVIDNGIGKRTFIRYRSSTEDLLRAQAAEAPWSTTLPMPVWVVSGVIDDLGLDRNGDGQPDRSVSTFDYRDGYYDGEERQFRGFAYAQRITWGDDLNDATGPLTGTGLDHLGAATAVTRYRFMTGAPDGLDNDETRPDDTGPRLIDESCTEQASPCQDLVAGKPLGLQGREEAPLKGKPVWVEEIDGGVLGGGEPHARFDRCAADAAWAAFDQGAFSPEASRCTPDRYVYSRTSSTWSIRALYRPEGATAPSGRLGASDPDSPQSVRWAVLNATETELPEANGWLREHLSDPAALVQDQPPVKTRQEFDYDNDGNRILERDLGVIEDPAAQPDERVTRRAFLVPPEQDGRIAHWMLDRPLWERVEDAEGRFASETRYYYDGPDFEGLPLGQLGSRGLVTRVEQRLRDGEQPLPPLHAQPRNAEEIADLTRPGDPRPDTPEWIDAERKGYDDWGNVTWIMDPLGQSSAGQPDLARGHVRRITYDPDFHALPVEERIYLDQNAPVPELAVQVEYQRPASDDSAAVSPGLGVITRSIDFNGHATDYLYDSFGRLTALVRPGDSESLPTNLFAYTLADPHRGLLYDYDRTGQLQQRDGRIGAIASSVRTEARERSGESDTLTQVAYVDGAGHALVSLEEDAVDGQFIARKATRYGQTGQPLAIYQPYCQQGTTFVPPPLSSAVQCDPAEPVYATEFTYDATGREIRTRLPPETAEPNARRAEIRTHHLPLAQWVFDEEALASADPSQPHLGTPSIRRFDGLGRLIGVDERVWNAGDGRQAQPETWHTRYAFDLNDQLVHIQDSQDNHKWFRFDGLGRKVYMHDLDRGEVFYTYDLASNLIETLDAAGQRVRKAYDGANRLLSERDDTGPLVTYHYDLAVPAPATAIDASQPTTWPLGQLTSVEDRSGAEYRAYDERGRMSWLVKTVSDLSPTSTSAFRTDTLYDAMDRVIDTRLPDGVREHVTYNDRGLPHKRQLNRTVDALVSSSSA
ncbi:toxin TcdB middle/N-terminal domain-containing protein [uncultured Thiocystis sp.]|jgi:hypothetical protein|uniref:toxin TcdB middle/N-terminal domain-containing protein n=1 Tax=uncultured Thiocystis sp. TaxID=1202134 RepID=UPI0025E56F3C|nr:toxin TcdB middle/N-terminal domain-containing protein [uncultured Thiocystis sp.]